MSFNPSTLLVTFRRWQGEPWFKPTVIGAVLTFLGGIVLIHYSQAVYPTNKPFNASNSGMVSEYEELAANSPVSVEPPRDADFDATLNEFQETSRLIAEQSSVTLDLLTTAFDSNLVKDCTFQNLEMNGPANSAGTFMKKYYGLDGQPALGPTLVETIIDQEVGWALKVAAIHPWEDNKSLIIATAAEDVCIHSTCTDEMYLGFVIATPPNSEIALELKAGDYLYVEGELHLWESSGHREEQFLHRLHIHPHSYRFSKGGTTDGCKEAVERLYQASKEPPLLENETYNALK